MGLQALVAARQNKQSRCRRRLPGAITRIVYNTLGLASNGYNGGVPLTAPPTPERLRLKADLTLLLVALVWGSAFVAQRVAALSMGVYLFNGLRFLLGVLVLLPLALRTRRDAAGFRASLPGMLLAGLLLFGGTSLQQLGLRYTTAANAGFITGLYVVLVPLLLALLWRQPPRQAVWLAAILSAVGLFLLSTGGSFSLKIGDALELAGAFLWAFHVLCIGWLVQRAEVIHISVVQCARVWLAQPGHGAGVRIPLACPGLRRLVDGALHRSPLHRSRLHPAGRRSESGAPRRRRHPAQPGGGLRRHRRLALPG